jgi:septum site-determining protein MinD
MGKVIVVTSGKGGVGKTTTTANLGTGLAMAGKRVVVIDADIGLRNLDVILGLENRIVYNLVDIVEETCRPKQAMIKDKKLEGLFLIPAAQTRDKSAITPEQMKTLTAKLKEDYDYVLIDCPAGIEQGFKNAIAGADEALVVTTPEVSAVRDADRIIGMLEAAEVPSTRLVINRIKQEMVLKGEMMGIDDVVEILAVDLLGIIPDDSEIVVASNKGEPVIYNKKSFAGQAYKNITDRIEGNDVPLMDLNGQVSVWTRLFSRWSK